MKINRGYEFDVILIANSSWHGDGFGAWCINVPRDSTWQSYGEPPRRTSLNKQERRKNMTVSLSVHRAGETTSILLSQHQNCSQVSDENSDKWGSTRKFAKVLKLNAFLFEDHNTGVWRLGFPCNRWTNWLTFLVLSWNISSLAFIFKSF